MYVMWPNNIIQTYKYNINRFFKKEDSKQITYQSEDNRSMIDYLMARKTDCCLVKDINVISSKDCVPLTGFIYNMQQCSKHEYHKRRKSVMKRQNEMCKQRVAAYFLVSNKKSFWI